SRVIAVIDPNLRELVLPDGLQLAVQLPEQPAPVRAGGDLLAQELALLHPAASQVAIAPSAPASRVTAVLPSSAPPTPASAAPGTPPASPTTATAGTRGGPRVRPSAA